MTGNTAALDELMAACERDGVEVTRIPVDYASHSAQIDGCGTRCVTHFVGCIRKPLTSRSSRR